MAEGRIPEGEHREAGLGAASGELDGLEGRAEGQKDVAAAAVQDEYDPAAAGGGDVGEAEPGLLASFTGLMGRVGTALGEAAHDLARATSGGVEPEELVRPEFDAEGRVTGQIRPGTPAMEALFKQEGVEYLETDFAYTPLIQGPHILGMPEPDASTRAGAHIAKAAAEGRVLTDLSTTPGQFHLAKVPDVAAGFGAYADRDLPAGTRLCAYLGRVTYAPGGEGGMRPQVMVPGNVAGPGEEGLYLERVANEKPEWMGAEKRGAYSMKMPVQPDMAARGAGRLAVDAATAGNEARFFNHAADDQANVRTQDMFWQKGGRIIPVTSLVTARDVRAGEQLCWNYGEEYWKTLGETPARWDDLPLTPQHAAGGAGGDGGAAPAHRRSKKKGGRR